MQNRLSEEENHELATRLNAFLKRSHYLNSMLDSQRMATAQALAIIMKALTKHDPSLAPVMLEAIQEIEQKTYTSPSLDGDRSLLARLIREEIRQEQNAQPQQDHQENTC